MNIYGAKPEEWLHFDLVLGLTKDLLPVVSNPYAVASERSSLKTLGKTPSRYNKKGRVVGIPNWSSYTSTTEQVDKWSNFKDYGICIQTRNIRAVDVDVPDTFLANQIKAYLEHFIMENTGIKMPCRFRANSSKFLIMFNMPGEFTKQIIKIDDKNFIEFLANGQQFIAVGTHPTGERYEWEGGLPYQIPTLTKEDFLKLWDFLAELSKGTKIQGRNTKTRQILNSNGLKSDDISLFLDKKWQVLKVGKFGERYIKCPFEDLHTTESNETATVYFPEGTGGFEQGHFKCMHAHCMGKDDGDFLNAIGYSSQYFDILPHDENLNPLPPFTRDKNGKIEASINNVYLAVQRPDICQIKIRFDQFKDEIMFAPFGSEEWQALTDADYSRLRIGLEKGGFKPIGRELIRDIVLLVADEHPFDSAVEWLSRLEWDGVPRVKDFLSEYFKAEKNDYTDAVSLYLWSALAGRVLHPGIKADMVPILIGDQGCGKSSGVAALSPCPDYFCEISFAEKEEDLARKMRGRLVCEIGELRGLHNRDLEAIKAFITRTHENWIPKYREFATQFPRRLIFIGTTNQDEILSDDTGNRRFLPVRVSDVNVEGIKTNLEQLWAEAKELFNIKGIQFNVVENLAKLEHSKYTIRDAWEEIVIEWLHKEDALTGIKPISKKYITTAEVLKWAIGIDQKNISRREEIRIGKVLHNLGFKKTVAKIEGKSVKAFMKGRIYHS